MTLNAYLSFLAVGIALILLDGQVIYRSGKRYLGSVDGTSAAAGSMARLAAMLFHLVTLGVLALLSTIDIGGSDLPGVVGRIGVLLLILALAHAITIAVLSRMRGERETEEYIRHGGLPLRRPDETTVTPVPGQEGMHPDVSPSLENRSPYLAP